MHFPVIYNEPENLEKNAMGFDMGSEESQRIAISAALDAGFTVAADPVRLGNGTDIQESLYVFKPVYADKYGESQVGVVSARILPKELLRTVQGYESDKETALRLNFYQLFSEKEPDLLAGNSFQDTKKSITDAENLSSSTLPGSTLPIGNTPSAWRIQEEADFTHIQPLFMFGKAYAFISHPSADFNVFFPQRLPDVLGLSGLALTLFFVGLVASYTNRDLYLSELVDLRTKELQESEQKFQIALRNSPIVVFQQDLDLRYQWLYNPNQYFEPADWIGKRDADLFPLKEAERLEKIKRKVIESGTGDRQVVCVSIAEQLSHYDLTVEPYYDEQGKLVGVTCSAIDISERIENEKQITRNLERSKRIYEITQYKAKDRQDLLDFALNAAMELTESQIGYIYLYDQNERKFVLNSWTTNGLKEGAIQKPLAHSEIEKAALWEEAFRQHRAVIDNHYKGAETPSGSYSEGHFKLQRFLSIPILVNQEIAAIVVAANKESDYVDVDILELTLLMDTVWKIVEQNRAEHTKVLQATALEVAANAIFITDAYGNVEWSNQAWSELSGYSLEEIVGEKPRVVETGEHGLGYYKHLLKTIRSGKAWRSEMINRRKDGSVYFCEATITPVKDQDSKITHYVVVMQDITARKHSEDKLLSQANEISRKNSQLEKLYRISQALLAGTTTLDIHQLSQLMIDLVTEELWAETGCLYEVHPAQNRLSLLASRTKDHHVQLQASILVDEVDLFAELIASKESCYIPDLAEFTEQFSWSGKNRSAIIAPLIHHNEAIALLAVLSPEVGRFQPEDVQLFSLYAVQRAVVLKNASLLAQNREQISRLEVFACDRRDN